MTKTTPKSGVGYASALCRTFVGPLLVVFFGFGTAHAGAWEEFERRCLVPMENVQVPILEGLLAVKSENQLETWIAPEGWKVNFRTSRDGSVCKMSELNWSDSESVSLLEWVRNAVPSKRYTAFAPSYYGAPMQFQSTEWREPRIEITVHLTESKKDVKLIVEETDLES